MEKRAGTARFRANERPSFWLSSPVNSSSLCTRGGRGHWKNDTPNVQVQMEARWKSIDTPFVVAFFPSLRCKYTRATFYELTIRGAVQTSICRGAWKSSFRAETLAGRLAPCARARRKIINYGKGGGSGREYKNNRPSALVLVKFWSELLRDHLDAYYLSFFYLTSVLF